MTLSLRLIQTASTVRCPYCHDDLASGAEVQCSGCGAGYHEPCLGESAGRCATLGCRGTVRARILPDLVLPAVTTARAVLNDVLMGAAMVVTMAGFVAFLVCAGRPGFVGVMLIHFLNAGRAALRGWRAFKAARALADDPGRVATAETRGGDLVLETREETITVHGGAREWREPAGAPAIVRGGRRDEPLIVSPLAKPTRSLVFGATSVDALRLLAVRPVRLPVA